MVIIQNFSNQQLIQNVIDNQLNNEDIIGNTAPEFNVIKAYFGDDYELNERIIIRQPSIQDFIDADNESDIYGVITPFVSNTTAYRLFLWEKMNKDWNKITNFELFSILIKTINPKYSHLIFGDLDLPSFDLYKKRSADGNEQFVLYSDTMNMEINEETKDKMCKYIQFIFNSYPPEEEFTSSKTLKQDLLNRDRQKQLQRQRETAENKSDQSLLSMIAFYLNHPGCKYKKDDLRNVKYFEFMYNLQRLQIYESTRALYGGMYSGMCDLSKVDKNEFNFMRDVKVEA